MSGNLTSDFKSKLQLKLSKLGIFSQFSNTINEKLMLKTSVILLHERLKIEEQKKLMTLLRSTYENKPQLGQEALGQNHPILVLYEKMDQEFFRVLADDLFFLYLKTFFFCLIKKFQQRKKMIIYLS